MIAQKRNDWLNNVSWLDLVETTNFGHAMLLSTL
jgi:hypothetical protein